MNLKKVLENNPVWTILCFSFAAFLLGVGAICGLKELFGYVWVPKDTYVLKIDLNNSYVPKEDYIKLSNELKQAEEDQTKLSDNQFLVSQNIETLDELSKQGEIIAFKHMTNSSELLNSFVNNILDDADFQQWKSRCLAFLKKSDPDIYQEFSTATVLPNKASVFDMKETIQRGIAVLEGYKLSLVNSKKRKGDSKKVM